MKLKIKIAAVAVMGINFGMEAQNKIESSGNVGIGTTNPSEKLEVFNSITTPGIISLKSIRNDAQWVDVGRLIAKQADTEVARIAMPRAGGSRTGFLTFWTKETNDSPLKESMRIDYKGNVGIGTTSPSSMLTVIGNSGIELKNKTTNENSMVIKPFLNVTNLNPGTSSYAAQITNQSLQHLVLDIKANDNQDSFAVRTDTNFDGNVDKIAMVIKPSGNMGIGTTDPNSILTIVGDSGIELKNKTTNENSMVIKPFLNVTNLNPGTSSYAAQITNQSLQHLVLDIKANDNQDSFAVRTDTNFDGNVDKIAMVIKPSGNVGIGTTKPDSQLSVNGKIHTKEVKVDLVGWSDFVFYEDYKLPTLREVETHIKENGHLKDIPSAKEVAKNGIFLGEMDSKLLQKIEELTLYTIQQEKSLQSQKEDIEKLKKENNALKSLNAKLLEIQKRLDTLESKK